MRSLVQQDREVLHYDRNRYGGEHLSERAGGLLGVTHRFLGSDVLVGLGDDFMQHIEIDG